MNRYFTVIIVFLSIFILVSCSTKKEQKTYLQDDEEFQIVVGHKMGGKVDGVARLIATAVERKIDNHVAIVNVMGNAGEDSLNYTFAKESDGHTVVFSNTLDGIWTHDILDEKELAWDINDWKTLGIYAELSNMGLVSSASHSWNDFAEFIVEARKRPGELKIGSLGPNRFEDLWVSEIQQFFDVTLDWKFYTDIQSLQMDIQNEMLDVGIIETQSIEMSNHESLQVLTVIGSDLPKDFPLDFPTLKDFERQLDFDIKDLKTLTMPTLSTIIVKADVPEETYEQLVQLMESIFTDESWQSVMPLYAWPTYYPPDESERLLNEYTRVLQEYQSALQENN